MSRLSTPRLGIMATIKALPTARCLSRNIATTSLASPPGVTNGTYKGLRRLGTAVKQADTAILFVNRDDVCDVLSLSPLSFEVAFSRSDGSSKTAWVKRRDITTLTNELPHPPALPLCRAF